MELLLPTKASSLMTNYANQKQKLSTIIIRSTSAASSTAKARSNAARIYGGRSRKA